MSSAEAIKLSISLLLRERAFVAHLRLWTKRGEGTREENVTFFTEESNVLPFPPDRQFCQPKNRLLSPKKGKAAGFSARFV